MKEVGGAVLAGSSPPFLGWERAAVDVDVGPERRSPRYHETCLALVAPIFELVKLRQLETGISPGASRRGCVEGVDSGCCTHRHTRADHSGV